MVKLANTVFLYHEKQARNLLHLINDNYRDRKLRVLVN